MKRIVFVAAFGALLILAGVAVACKSNDSGLKDRVSVLETQVGQMNTASQNASMVLALQALSAMGLHAFSTSVDGGTLPPGESGPVQQALAAVAAVQWPSDLQSQAQDMNAKLAALLSALATDDVNQVKGPAAAAHDGYHMFADSVYTKLTAALALPTMGTADSMQTPMPTAMQMPVKTPTP